MDDQPDPYTAPFPRHMFFVRSIQEGDPFSGVRGAVVDSQGTPIPGTMVIVVPTYSMRKGEGIRQFYGWALNDGLRDSQLHYTGVSNVRGEFEIRDIPYSGMTRLYIQGYGRIRCDLSLKPGEMSMVDIVLEDRPTLVRGRVLTSAGAPVTDAVVDMPVFQGDRSGLREQVLAYTDRQGYFSLWLPGAGMAFVVVASRTHGKTAWGEENVLAIRAYDWGLSGSLTKRTCTLTTDQSTLPAQLRLRFIPGFDGRPSTVGLQMGSQAKLGDSNQESQVYTTYSQIMFRAESTTAELTFSDWKDGKPAGPAGQRIAFNFVELQPFFE